MNKFCHCVQEAPDLLAMSLADSFAYCRGRAQAPHFTMHIMNEVTSPKEERLHVLSTPLVPAKTLLLAYGSIDPQKGSLLLRRHLPHLVWDQ